MIKNHRIALLIKLLSKYHHPVNSKEICEQLKIKPRTLREDITRSREDLEKYGVELISKHGVGYSLSILDEDKYYSLIKLLLKNEQRRHFVLPIHTPERVNYLIRTFLSADDYLKLDDIADEIYISRSTLNNCLKLVREELKNYELELVSKPAYGIKISGDELNLRRAIARYFFYDDSYQQLILGDERENESRTTIRNILVEVLSENKIKLTDLGFQNLIIHLEIALMRISKTHYSPNVSQEYQMLEKRAEYPIAKQLALLISQHLQIQLPELEIYFITIHLMGKRSFNHDNSFVITPEIEQLFNKIFHHIDEVFGLNLLDDFELYTLLALHFRPMLDRLTYKLNISNPMLDQIKEENIKAFEIALLAGQIIYQETGLEVNEAEIGYMAIHFALAIERQSTLHRKQNVIVVCASGTGSSQLLLYRIKQRFSDYLDQIQVVQLYELKNFNQRDFDFIISTVDIPFQTDIRILRVHYFMDNQDVIQMEQYFNRNQHDSDLIDKYFLPTLFFTDLNSQERYSLIQEMCERIAEHQELESNFTQLVIEREQLSSTEFGNQIAFPHPIQHSGNRTFVSVAVMEKPVKWDKQMVRYIFMLNVRHDEHDSLQLLHESLTELMCDNQKLKQLEQNQTFDTLIKLLKQTVNEAEKNLQLHSFK